MQQAEVERFVDAVAREAREAAQAAVIRQQADAFLRAPAGIETVLRIAAKDEQPARRDVACALLGAALDVARMAAENGSPDGPRLLGVVEVAVRQIEATDGLDAASRSRLAQVYARAELEPPPEARLTPEVLASATREAAQQMPDVAGMLKAVLRQAGQDPLQAHAYLVEAIAAFPHDARAQFVQVIGSHQDPVAPRLALYWLLDRLPAVRLAAATALLGRANAGQLDAQAGSVLPILRKWLPAEPARAVVDAAIKAWLRGGGGRQEAVPWKIQRVVASLPDGAGAQSIAALVQQGRRRGVALLLLKQGHGVKDAFIQACSSAREQEGLLAEIGGQIALIEMHPDHVAAALSRALGDGAAHDSLPPPGLIDMTGIWGGEMLGPVPSDTRAIMAAIGADEALAARTDAEREGLLGVAGATVADQRHFDAWFEDTSELAERLAKTRGDRQRQAAAWKYLETRRDWWARQLAVCAATLKASFAPNQADWLSFAAGAQALLDQRPLRRIPVMEHIVPRSLGVADSRSMSERPAGAPLHVAAPRPEKRGELARLLSAAAISEAYVQGYLTGLAVCPRPVSIESWLGPLLGGIELRGEGKIQRAVDLVIMRANQIDEETADQETVKGWIAALDDSGLRDWTKGFSTLVAATRGAWSARVLAPAERRTVENLHVAAKGGELDPLRAVLPAWIAARHARRR
ncbi:MAG TPA: UPF0149 family protein [Falsiroseomonas sp.]|jgi:hypothetical protein|nr:UPF0149 family protein [Falsiroseomonas sp.]